MVGYNMNGPTRDQVLKFIEEKERIEREIQEMHLVLETNNVGMRDSLVDQDGFPRNDIDVYRVRHARHRIICTDYDLKDVASGGQLRTEDHLEWQNLKKACLQNDHKEIMKQIERGLHAMHSEFMGPDGEGPSRSRTGVQPMDTSTAHVNGTSVAHTNGRVNGSDSHVALVVEGTRDLRVRDRAFVKVNYVSAGSPAELAGIRVDDEILEFGSVNGTNFHNLAQIADVVQHSVGSRVNVRVQRGGTVLNVSLVPNAWAGRGLLGCNIVPV